MINYDLSSIGFDLVWNNDLRRQIKITKRNLLYFNSFKVQGQVHNTHASSDLGRMYQ